MNNKQVVNTASSILAAEAGIIKNSLEVLSALSASTTSSTSEVAVKITQSNNEVKELTIPSFSWIKSELSRLDSNFKSLSALDSTDVTVRLSDGTFKKIYATQFLKEPNPIGKLDIPSTFFKKSNYFFENLMEPMIYVGLDISKYIDSNVREVVVKRLLLDIDTVDKLSLFNKDIKGKSDLSYDNVIQYLLDNSISFASDEETVRLPISIARYSGTFDVLQILDSTTLGNGSTTRRYRLNTLHYNDNLSLIKNTIILQPGNILIKGDSKYAVDIVNSDDNTVFLRKLSGPDSITIGTDILSIYSELYSNKEAQISVGINEHQIVFLKPINYTFNSASSDWSPGIGFFSNELYITIGNEKLLLPDFYRRYVLDLGADLLAHAREKRIPNFNGVIPSVPKLFSTNFKVLQIDNHKGQQSTIDTIKSTYASLVQLKNEISSLGDQIYNDRVKIASGTLSESDRVNLQTQLSLKIDKQSSLQTQFKTQVSSIISVSNGKTEILNAPKYRIRGFWDIPNPSVTPSGKIQNIVQFKYRYRYLQPNQVAPDSQPYEYQTNNGSKVTGYFSNWVEIFTKPRKKVYNPLTNEYEWKLENTTDPEEVNTNQLDIPISDGESVEIQVQSISEAGYPENPLISKFSDSVFVDFPDELRLPDVSDILKDSVREDSRLSFLEELNNQGITKHVKDSITVGSNYYAHSSLVLDSGFKDQNGTIISLYDKIRSLEQEILALKSTANKVKGKLNVKITDSLGNSYTVNNNASILIFAGYYSEMVKSLAEADRKGAIITKQFMLSISNDEQSPLQLISKFPGGTGDSLPSASNNWLWRGETYSDGVYKQSKKYEDVPLSISSSITKSQTTFYDSGNVKQQPAPFQSRQVPGQFLYMRWNSIDGVTPMYSNNDVGPQYLAPDFIGNSSSASATFVWNQQFETKSLANGSYLSPKGNGKITQFCISTDHPDLKISLANSTTSTTSYGIDFFNNQMVNSNPGSFFPRFMHSAFFNLTQSENKGKMQLGYQRFDSLKTQLSTANYLSAYPSKLGFYENDRYLIGSNTCGSYLFIQPPTYSTISVDGNDSNSIKNLSQGASNSINIPIIFQFRMTDYWGGTSEKVGFIGGWKPNISSTSSNPTYTKRLGFDLFINNESPLSFDVEVYATYKADSISQSSTNSSVGITSSNKNAGIS